MTFLETKMIDITFVDADKKKHDLQAKPGISLMEVAKAMDIRGIDADCGGNAACGTCAISFGDGWAQQLEGRSEEESDMLEFAVQEPSKCRLACQVQVTEDMAGLVAVVETEQD